MPTERHGKRTGGTQPPRDETKPKGKTLNQNGQNIIQRQAELIGLADATEYGLLILAGLQD